MVTVYWDNAGDVAISDERGNAYAPATARTKWYSSWSTQTFFARNIAAGTNTVRATFATAIDSYGIVQTHEYSGLDRQAPLDDSATRAGSGKVIGSGPVTSSAADGLLFAAAGSVNAVTAVGPDYTPRLDTSGNRTMDRIVPAAGDYDATATNSGGRWVMQLVAFKPSGAEAPDTTPPSVPTGLDVQAVSSTQASLSWNYSVDNVGVTGYRIYRDGAFLKTSTVTPVQDADLTPGTTYSYAVSAYDAAGNESAQTTPVSVHTPEADNIPPSASMTAPAAGSTVGGTVTVSASATDNVAVADVEFLLDGVGIGIDTTAPYSIAWDTTTTSNGLHSLSARARDAAGNFGVTSGVVQVTVDNPSVPQLPAGLVAGWNFDEGTGATAADVSGNGNGAALEGGPAWTAGKYGTGMTFDGINDFLSVPNSPTVNLGGAAMTLSAWVRPNGGAGDQVLLGKAYHGSMTSPYYQYGLELQGGFVPVLVIGGPAGVQAVQGDALPTGEWSHLSVVFDGAEVRFFVNGALARTRALPSGLTQRDTPLHLGADVTPSQFFTGTLDDVRMYSRALTAAEVQSDMTSPLKTPGADPSAPTVSITAPATGAEVGGNITVTADAVDDVGVAGVTFFVDGSPVGPQDTEAPYGANWDTRTYSNGAHTLTARAVDTAGNFAVSAPVTVNVTNTDHFQNEVLATGFDLPTAMKFLPDGRMLVAELQGRIKVVPPPYTTPDTELFGQITNIGSAGVQQGIYDIALDPDFTTNHYYYVFYTAATPDEDRLSRFTANELLTGTVPSSELILYHALGTNPEHHGGAITFANDGKILFTTGEHFGPQLAQDLTDPKGKLHRINRDGTVPTDNPFYDGNGPNWDSIWAYGLRNPWRAYYDAPTGRMFIADVGGNDPATAHEEINLGERGANYGWPDYEGACPPPCTAPLYEYAHAGRDAAVTGGFVYRGDQFPASMRGSYFFADYAQNWIRRLTFDADGNVSGVFNFEPASDQLDGPTGDVVYLTEGPDGALYYLDLGYSDVTGDFGISKVRRIRYVQAGNQAPIAQVTTDRTTGAVPLTVTFSSAGSSDPEGEPLTYLWDFGDGTTSTEADPTHTYTLAGQYLVRLTVSDGTNTTFSTPLTITAGGSPTASITTPASGQTFRAGDVIAFSGDATDPEDGPVPASGFRWTVDFLHDGHVHPGQVITGVRDGSITVPTKGHDFGGNTRYRITLTVTDADGLTDTKSVTVLPEKVDLAFASSPSGLALYVDGIPRTTPFTLDTLVGFTHTIEARDQSSGGTAYAFDSWSDGGARQHDITVPAAASAFTAAFLEAPPPDNGPVVAWGFDEGSGSTAADASGNGNDATLVNGPAWASGQYGTAVSFDGQGQYLTVPSSPSLDIAGDALTMSMWLKPQSASGDSVVLGKFWDAGMTSPYYQYGLELRGTEPMFLIGTADGLKVAQLEASLPLNQWSHLGIVFDGSRAAFYVDGEFVVSRPLSASITARGRAMRVGADADPGQFYTGQLDNVRIHARALTAAEVQSDRTQAVTASAPPGP